MATIIKKFPVVSFFVLTYLINWLGMAALVAGVFPSFGEWTLVYDGHDIAQIRGRRTFLIWAPNIAAMIVLGITDGRRAVGRLMGQFLKWRVSLRWWMCAFGLPVVLTVLTILMFAFLGGAVDLSQSGHWVGVFVLRLLFSLTTGGFGEEAGWRGFALPRLQRKMGALPASLLIGVVWSLWHWTHWTLIGLSLPSILVMCAAITALSVVLTWIYNSSGSLLLVALMHVLFNALEATFSRSFAAVMPGGYFMGIFACVVVVFAVVLTVSSRGKLQFPLQSADR
jgi:membrane protease YdiL (CAAX protease family)